MITASGMSGCDRNLCEALNDDVVVVHDDRWSMRPGAVLLQPDWWRTSIPAVAAGRKPCPTCAPCRACGWRPLSRLKPCWRAWSHTKSPQCEIPLKEPWRQTPAGVKPSLIVVNAALPNASWMGVLLQEYSSALALCSMVRDPYDEFPIERFPTEVSGVKEEKQAASDMSTTSIESLREEITALREAVRARDDFISIAAHELRNPMTPLVGQINLLRKNARNAGAAVPERILHGIERLDLIVRRYIRRTTTLLDISRLTSGRFHLDLAMVEVSTVVSDVAADFAVHAAAAGSVLSLFIEKDIVGLLDRTAVEEIAENLISNAIKYGSGEPIDVTLQRDDGYFCLRVRDRGLGISAKDQGRILERFERLMTGRPTVGFGLGLWVVGQLTESMGGTIAVASNPGHGSTFKVRLPLQRIEGNR
jgi:two-component system, OmpR family, sensor kinase